MAEAESFLAEEASRGKKFGLETPVEKVRRHVIILADIVDGESTPGSRSCVCLGAYRIGCSFGLTLPGTMRYYEKIAVLHRDFAICGMFVAVEKYSWAICST